MATMPSLSTPVTELFGIKHPVMLAGMNIAAGPELVAAVSNAGGLGVFGGVNYTPKMLRMKIKEVKDDLKDPKTPFGVDLLLPKVGDGARATNKDYTHGTLSELIDVIIEEGASLFVAAIGVPPKFVVDKLHAAGIPVMNMIGSPNHVQKALESGVDLICAQGGEGGGHTGEVATSILIPTVVDLVRGKMSPLTGKQVSVVAAGGIFDGRGLAMALSLGADAVWVGTRFVAATEGGAPKLHKEAVVRAGVHDTHRCEAFTGRPLRVIKTSYSERWLGSRLGEMRELLAKGTVPVEADLARWQSAEDSEEEQKKLLQQFGMDSFGSQAGLQVHLCGQVAGAIREVLPAQAIVDEMVSGACEMLRGNFAKVSWPAAKL
jgi:NAD(P)H-dependent flavin oxidoreductase YrpB (nitropropane dioxygenase family)